MVLCCLGNCLFFFSFSFLSSLFLSIPFSLGWELTLFSRLPDRNFSLGRLECPNTAIPQTPCFPLRPGNQSINQSEFSDFSAAPPCENRTRDVRQRHPSGCLPSPLVAGGSTTLVGSGKCGGKKKKRGGRIHHREGWGVALTTSVRVCFDG